MNAGGIHAMPLLKHSAQSLMTHAAVTMLLHFQADLGRNAVHTAVNFGSVANHSLAAETLSCNYIISLAAETQLACWQVHH